MSTPSQPKDPPKTDAKPDAASGGVPDGAEQHEPTGTPTADRHKTETSPKK